MVDKEHKISMLANLTAGAASGGLARLCVAPLDVVKIRLQIQSKVQSGKPGSVSTYSSILHAFRTIAREEGLLAFWKGNMAAELMVMSYTGVSFLAYSSTSQWLQPHHQHASQTSPYVSLASGSVAGFAATLATYPLDLLRTRLAAQREPKIYPSFRAAVSSISKQEGFRGFYAGVWPTLIGIVPYTALQFMLYETFKDIFAERRHREYVRLHPATATASDHATHADSTSQDQFVCGFLSGLLSKLLTMPFDVVKKRFQVATFAWERPANGQTGAGGAASYVKPTPYKNMFDCAAQIVRHDGITGLWRGTIPSLLKAGPNSAITFFVYEGLLRYMSR